MVCIKNFFVAAFFSACTAQTFQRLGTCPTLGLLSFYQTFGTVANSSITGCVFPPDQVDFLAGQFFDIRLEVHAPVNGSESTGNSTPDPNFTFTIARGNGKAQNASTYFGTQEPALEQWSFSYYEGIS